MSRLLLVAGEVDERWDSLGKGGIRFGDSRDRDRVESLERDVESIAVLSEARLRGPDDGDDGGSEVGTASRLDMRKASAKKRKHPRLN